MFLALLAWCCSCWSAWAGRFAARTTTCCRRAIRENTGELERLRGEIKSHRERMGSLDSEEAEVRRSHEDIQKEIELTHQLLGEMVQRELILSQQSELLEKELAVSIKHYQARREALARGLRNDVPQTATHRSGNGPDGRQLHRAGEPGQGGPDARPPRGRPARGRAFPGRRHPQGTAHAERGSSRNLGNQGGKDARERPPGNAHGRTDGSAAGSRNRAQGDQEQAGPAGAQRTETGLYPLGSRTAAGRAGRPAGGRFGPDRGLGRTDGMARPGRAAARIRPFGPSPLQDRHLEQRLQYRRPGGQPGGRGRRRHGGIQR